MDSFLLLVVVAVEPGCDDLGRLAPLGLASTDVGDDMKSYVCLENSLSMVSMARYLSRLLGLMGSSFENTYFGDQESSLFHFAALCGARNKCSNLPHVTSKCLVVLCKFVLNCPRKIQ